MSFRDRCHRIQNLPGSLLVNNRKVELDYGANPQAFGWPGYICRRAGHRQADCGVPLAGGLLSGKYSRANQKPADSRRTEFDFPIVDKERTWKILDAMTPIAKAHGCSCARISLAWLLAKPVVSSVIIGVKRHDQLQDNLAAVELTLTQEEIKRLDEVSALPPEYPGWMLQFQGADRLEAIDRLRHLRQSSISRSPVGSDARAQCANRRRLCEDPWSAGIGNRPFPLDYSSNRARSA